MDGLLRISLLEGQARAFLIDSTALTEEARKIHDLSHTATAALGRLLTGTAIMGSMLKNKNDSVTVSIRGGGEMGLLLAVGQSDGSVKGYVEHPEVDPERRNGKLNVGGAVGKNGMLTVVKDMGLREPYVGQVHLVSGEIAEDFAMYFTASEQTPSLVSLGVLVAREVIAAGGLLIQLMPGASEAAIQSIELSAGMFRDISATIRDYGLHGAVNQLLMHLQPEILEEIPVRYECNCSRERVERALISLGVEELESMLKEQNGAEVGCSFCNSKHNFTAEELSALIEGIRSREE
ncbi:MAG: Hsp33 family molecular chaperone HslO [Clostridiales bacterium]|nr:Hsp33 family molecular chaperone HslO [Clostridiales bacterium]